MTDADTQKLAADDAAWEAWPHSDDYAERDAFRSGYLAAIEQQVAVSDARLREAVERCALIAETPQGSLMPNLTESPCQWQRRCIAKTIRAISIPTKEETDVCGKVS